MLSPNDISRTVFTYLETIALLPPILYIDSVDQPTDDHLRAYILPAVTEANGIAYDSNTRQFGIVQINVFVKESKGANFKSGGIVEDVLSAFIRGTTLTGIEFNKPPVVSAPTASGGFLMVAVSAEYTIID